MPTIQNFRSRQQCHISTPYIVAVYIDSPTNRVESNSCEGRVNKISWATELENIKPDIIHTILVMGSLLGNPEYYITTYIQK